VNKNIIKNIVKEVLFEMEMAIGGGGWDSNNDIVHFHGYPSGYGKFPKGDDILPEDLPNKREVNKDTYIKLFESNEDISFHTFENGDEFYQYISKNGPNGTFDPRFMRKNDGGEKAFKYFSYSDYQIEPNNVKIFVIKINDIVAGMAHIRKSESKENTWFLSHISIDPLYENKGYASMLSNYMFKWFRDNNINFETSSYTEEGYIKLKPLFNRLSLKYDVKFIDKGKL
jgi:GNAT superfamily N-acetyltransferase